VYWGAAFVTATKEMQKVAAWVLFQKTNAKYRFLPKIKKRRCFLMNSIAFY